ncbi:MAG: type II toxin-antitoxin system HipA family toxin [Pseudomonadota bacterium]
MKPRKLYIHYDTKIVGILTEDENSLPHFSFDSSWSADQDAFPLSLALPLREEPYTGKVVTSFFENLIPEGDQRRQIEQIAGLPAADDAAYLERFGEDCAGALSISIHRLPIAQSKETREKNIPYQSIEDSIKKGIPVSALLGEDGDFPPFSLAGAQAKFACCIREGKIYLPGAGQPTTHIVKLPIRSGEKLLDSVLNEYLSMRLAKICGLAVPDVMILGDKVPLFGIERFDRATSSNFTRRLHAQDFCQAFGIPSREKYETHGGPSFALCYGLVREHSTNAAHDLLGLIDWVGFNLALGNNDSHAKNLSLILSSDGIKLAPFYDIVCTALYPHYSSQFAFRFEEVRSWDKITNARIDVFSKHLGLHGNFVISRWTTLFDKLNAGFQELLIECSTDKARTKTLKKIGLEIKKRTQSLEKAFQKKSPKK